MVFIIKSFNSLIYYTIVIFFLTSEKTKWETSKCCVNGDVIEHKKLSKKMISHGFPLFFLI